MRLLIPLGTRPEIIKLAPVIHALAAGGFELRTVATGQHYDPALTDSFFEDLIVVPELRRTPAGKADLRWAQQVAAAGHAARP